MAKGESGGCGLDPEVVEELTRRDKIMLLQVLERADAEDFQVKEIRGWGWQQIARILADPRTPRRLRDRAAGRILDRSDPIPRALVQALVQGDLSITWALPSSSPTPLAPSKPSSTTPLPGNGHGRASPSAIDDLESL